MTRLPPCFLIRQKFQHRGIVNIPEEVQKQLAKADYAALLKTGSRVAIGVTSRGIRNLHVIVREVVRYWIEHGMKPFLFPAMGSHGAASAEGQAEVLARHGITEAEMGCPVISCLDVVSLGKTGDGIEAFMDRTAYESDAVMLVARVKWHTDFTGKIESGLFKMMALGLGKFAGAQRYHSYAYKLGLEHVIVSVGRMALASGKILGGLAILEDAYHNTAKLEAVHASEMEQREIENLALVKSWMGKLPADLDILILDEMGKDISGCGMDTKVVNRSVHAHYNPFSDLPAIGRIFVRGLSELSYRSAVGIGLADVTTTRLVDSIDPLPTQLNAITATALANVRIPIHYDTDRECLEMLARTVGKSDPRDVVYAWVRNTLQLAELLVSVNLREQLQGRPDIEIAGEAHQLPFDEQGNLVTPFQSIHH